MFTRRFIMDFKPGSAAEVRRIFDGEIIPLLRGHEGMRHDDAFISPELSEAVLNSYWDTRGCAEAYSRATHPATLSALAEVLEGTPRVETFEISSSTFRQITARRRRSHRDFKLWGGVWASAPMARYPSVRQGSAASVNCKIAERSVGAVTILDLDGEVRTGGSRGLLHDAIARLSGEGRNQVLLNLAGLTAIDASGLGELLLSSADLNKGGGQLKLLRPTRGLREMLTITKLLRVFDIYEDEPKAVAAFAKPVLDAEGRLLSYELVRYETNP